MIIVDDLVASCDTKEWDHFFRHGLLQFMFEFAPGLAKNAVKASEKQRYDRDSISR